MINLNCKGLKLTSKTFTFILFISVLKQIKRITPYIELYYPFTQKIIGDGLTRK